MERFITDSPQDNNAMQMNYAYAKDSQVVLRYAGGEYDIPLTEYIAKCAKNDHGCKGVTPESVMRGDSCSECDCALAILNVVSIQAAELRGRLKAYEDTGLQPEEIIGLCEMDKRAKMADLLRLEEYQSLGDIALLRQLSEADRDGRVLIAEYPIGTPVYKLNHGTKVETRVIDGIRYQRDVPADYITVHLYDFADAEVRAENPEYAQSRYGKLYTQKPEAEAALGVLNNE